MRHPDPIDTMWVKATVGGICSIGLFLWGYFKPEWSMSLMGSAVPFPVRWILWVVAGVLLATTIGYVVRNIRAWMDR